MSLFCSTFHVRPSAVLLIFLFFSGTPIKAPSGRNLRATSLHVYGRYALDEAKGVELIGSAAHTGFSFDGTTCKIYTSLNSNREHNYLQYELDGVYHEKIKISGDDRQPVVINATTTGRHTVWIYKATEAHTGPIFIEKVVGNRIVALVRPEAPYIEFIGNSITCGAAADPSEIACGTGVYHDQHDAYHAYGPRVARALGANFILSSVSGIGVYRNWNSSGPAMPTVYEQVDFHEGDARSWNFEQFTPAVVSIALGTNDFSNGDGKQARLPFDSTAFVYTYIRFVELVKSKYPAARVVLLNSPLMQGNWDTLFRRCLGAVKDAIDKSHPTDTPVSLFFFKGMHARGCSGHPSVEDHEILADEVLPFFENVLGGQ